MSYEIDLPEGWRISDDAARLDRDMICRFLSEDSYWAQGRSWQVIMRAIEHSLCLGFYAPDGVQAGFARVISDRATLAHLTDVFVRPAWRGQGRGKALVAAVLGHPELVQVTRWTLGTKDAHGLYRNFGFGPVLHPERQMMRQTPFPGSAKPGS